MIHAASLALCIKLASADMQLTASDFSPVLWACCVLVGSDIDRVNCDVDRKR